MLYLAFKREISIYERNHCVDIGTETMLPEEVEDRCRLTSLFSWSPLYPHHRYNTLQYVNVLYCNIHYSYYTLHCFLLSRTDQVTIAQYIIWNLCPAYLEISSKYLTSRNIFCLLQYIETLTFKHHLSFASNVNDRY